MQKSLSRPAPAHLLACALAVLELAAPSRGAAQEVTAAAAYTGEGIALVSGGRSGEEAFLGNLDLTLELRDRKRALTVFAYVLGNHGEAPSALVGDAQGVSNIEAPDALRLYEAWIEKELAASELSLLAGLYDLNSEFDVVESGLVFLNSSFGIGAEFAQSGRAGPSIFPVTSLGLRAAWRPAPELVLRGAVLDAVPGDPDDPSATHVRLSPEEGALLAAEAAWHPGDAGGSRVSAKLALGAWRYTSRFPETGDAAGERRARPGIYALAEGPLVREEDPDQGLSVFGRAGWADPRVHRFGGYTGAGASYAGLLPGRDEDTAGLGVAVAWNGRPYRDARVSEGVPATRAETVVELTYRWEGKGWAVQPDLQWVIHPDTRSDVSDAWVLGLRVEAGASFASGGPRQKRHLH